MNNEIVKIQSVSGLVVLYDPTLLRDRVKAPSSWWRDDVFATSERGDGRLAVWPLGGGRAASRCYRARLTTELTEMERTYVRGETRPAPIRVEGGEMFLGPAERLPGDGSGDRLPDLPEQGGLVRMEPGLYSATVLVLDWKSEERFFNDDNEPTPDAPPDFVIRLDGSAELVPPPEEPRPLLEFIPKKTPLASKRVIRATRPPPRDPEPERKSRRKSSAKKNTKSKSEPRQRDQVVALRTGELGVGARVRHPVYGVGHVTFMREGFPKVRVSFHDREYKVDKDDLTVVS